MKKIILLILLVISTKSIAQIYFSPNAAMYVKNEVLYVQQDMNLAGTSNLYLRNNSQLVQGTTGASTNKGAGTLSVFQEGTSDNFDYNYWCSPVGNPSITTGNENFGITMLNSPTNSISSTAAIVLPVNNSNGIASPLSISPRWIYKLINANNYSQWVFVGGASTLAPGEGFSMKGTSGTDATNPEGTGITNNPGSAQRYDFRGKPNDGNISITLGINNATLTGNPYPSALHLNAFLLDPTNTATGGIAYFWEQDKTVNSHTLVNYKGGYGSYAPVNLTSSGVYVAATFNSYKGDGTLNTTGLSSGLSINRRYSPIGQGFVISATANGTATFKNAHRDFIKESAGSSQFEKHSDTKKEETEKVTEEKDKEVSHFKLNTIINNEFTRQLALAFVPEATDGIDLGIDALNMDDALPNDVTFWLANASYVIQGIAFDETKKVPLAVKVTTATTFKFYIPEVINFDVSHAIYLYDALDDSYHDIKNGSYQVIVDPGVYNDRFQIRFKDKTVIPVDEPVIVILDPTKPIDASEATNTEFLIFQDNKNNLLTAVNPKNISVQSFTLYNVLGKVILAKKDLGSNQKYLFSTNGLSNGVYIAEFVTKDNQRITEKVIISSSSN